ncbi:MAG: hypothetical protein SPF36_09345 [Lachnospiraceae bacterium]|nr:hypothetical protein [Lachnospiraceae bacterium]
MTIDIDKLRDDMRDNCIAAYFVGGFGGALFETFDIDRATPEELIKMAQNRGIDLRRYQV